MVLLSEYLVVTQSRLSSVILGFADLEGSKGGMLLQEER